MTNNIEIKKGDFVELEFDLYANDKLVQTTNEHKGKSNGLKTQEYGSQIIIIGQEFLIKALDENILKEKQGDKKILNLAAKDAYGLRKKNLIKVLPKSAFDEHKTKPILGMIYDFNGMYGTVKSIVGGRVMVDFNSPLAAKDIRIEYKVISKIEDISKKISHIFKTAYKLPLEMFKIEIKEKEITIQMHEQLIIIAEQIKKNIEELIPEIKNYSLKIEKFKKN